MITNKAFMLGKLFNVVEEHEFIKNPIEYVKRVYNLAVHTRGLILPVYQVPYPSPMTPGIYMDNMGYEILMPKRDGEEDVYSDTLLARIGDAQSFREVLDAKEKLFQDEYSHLTNNDDVFIPNMDRDTDTKLMYAVKAAIAAKQCNINNYADRFGNDFNNDKRKFNGNSITAGKAETILSNTDVRVSLVVQDMSPNVANPIGGPLVFPWIGDGVHDEEYVRYISDALKAKGPIKIN